jgi:hypothetical protein
MHHAEKDLHQFSIIFLEYFKDYNSIMCIPEQFLNQYNAKSSLSVLEEKFAI